MKALHVVQIFLAVLAAIAGPTEDDLQVLPVLPNLDSGTRLTAESAVRSRQPVLQAHHTLGGLPTIALYAAVNDTGKGAQGCLETNHPLDGPLDIFRQPNGCSLVSYPRHVSKPIDFMLPNKLLCSFSASEMAFEISTRTHQHQTNIVQENYETDYFFFIISSRLSGSIGRCSILGGAEGAISCSR